MSKKESSNHALLARKRFELIAAGFLVALALFVWMFLIWLSDTIQELKTSLYVLGAIGFVIAFLASLFFGYIWFGYPKSKEDWYYYQRQLYFRERNLLEQAYKENFGNMPNADVFGEANNPGKVDKNGNNL